MIRKLLPILLACTLPLWSACDDDDDDDGGSSASASASASAGDGATSSSMMTCNSSHDCINDVCECTTAGKDGDSCTDDTACVDECEVCM